MALVYQDYAERRKRESRAPLPKKIGRKKHDIIIEAQKIPGELVGKKLTTILNENFGMDESSREKIKNALIGHSGFEHLNPNLLAVMWLFLRDNPTYDPVSNKIKGPPLTFYTGEKLDYYLKRAFSKKEKKFETLTGVEKQRLYASIFRYVDWYITTKEDFIEEETGPSEEKELSESEAEVQDEEQFEEEDIYLEGEEEVTGVEEGEREIEEEEEIKEGKQEEELL